MKYSFFIYLTINFFSKSSIDNWFQYFSSGNSQRRKALKTSKNGRKMGLSAWRNRVTVTVSSIFSLVTANIINCHVRIRAPYFDANNFRHFILKHFIADNSAIMLGGENYYEILLSNQFGVPSYEGYVFPASVIPLVACISELYVLCYLSKTYRIFVFL